MPDGERKILNLSDLLGAVRECVSDAFPSRLWVRAEISEVKNHPSGHCYLTLVESSEKKGLVAKASAVIWASSYRLLRPYFESETGEGLSVGMTVLVCVQVQYSELYSLSLVITDIDPSYTLGELERERRATIARLQQEGMMDMNATLDLPRLPRRLAVISAETAAGYRDFMHHLHDNEFGFRFETELFPAVMQGREAPGSIVDAMDAVAARTEEFDALLMLRGGGGAMDLICFDDYDLAVNVAQFPIPVLTGIGHDHDYHIVDMVAHTNVKTPTALADYMVDLFAQEDAQLESLAGRLRLAVRGKGTAQMAKFDSLLLRIRAAVDARVRDRLSALDRLEMRVTAADPSKVLSRGFTMTLKGGRKVLSASELSEGDPVKVLLGDGSAEAVITKIEKY